MEPLTNLQGGEKGKIIELGGGYTFRMKLRIMGIREGKVVKVITTQPFYGPIVVEIAGKQTTLGRGMAERIFVERIQKNK